MILVPCCHCMPYTDRFLSMASLASLNTLTDGVAMVARSWTNMSDIPEEELDDQIKALCLQLLRLTHPFFHHTYLKIYSSFYHYCYLRQPQPTWLSFRSSWLQNPRLFQILFQSLCQARALFVVLVHIILKPSRQVLRALPVRVVPICLGMPPQN